MEEKTESKGWGDFVDDFIAFWVERWIRKEKESMWAWHVGRLCFNLRKKAKAEILRIQM